MNAIHVGSLCVWYIRERRSGVRRQIVLGGGAVGCLATFGHADGHRYLEAAGLQHSRRYVIITPTVVGVYRDWPGYSASNLYI